MTCLNISTTVFVFAMQILYAAATRARMEVLANFDTVVISSANAFRMHLADIVKVSKYTHI